MPKRQMQEEFIDKVRKKLGPDYKVLGKYVNNRTKIEMLHYKCGNTFMKIPHDVDKGSGCPYCYGNKPAKYNEEYVINNTPTPYKYIKGYTKFSEKCVFYCNKCKTYFKQTPRRIIIEKIYGCNCCPTKKKTHQDFLEELGEQTLKEFEILSEYSGMDKKIKIKHKKCGTVLELTPYQFITRHNKKYCPICYYKKSQGEIVIAQFLQENNIEFQKEFVFPNLKKYRFDFYLPELNTIIEYDGAQHFYPVDYFGGEKALLETQRRDQEKNQYCLNNKITLLRIPYTEFDYLNQILYEIFKEKSSTTIERFKIIE